MGSASSKASKSLATAARRPPPPLPSSTVQHQSDNPQLLANLARLGPVRVQNPVSRPQPQPLPDAYPKTSSQNPDQGPTKNRITAQNLAALLTQLQLQLQSNPHQNVSTVVQAANLSSASFTLLARHIAVPSVGRHITVKRNDERDDVLREALWNPVYPPTTTR